MTAPVAPDRGAVFRSDRSALITIGLIWAFLWLAIDPRGDFPLNDDWAYAFAVKSILGSNRFALTGFSAPNLIAQAYWGALFCLPFGFSFEALRLSTFVLALAGVLCAFKLLRELGADRVTAAVGALTLGVNPLFLQYSASFMTDVPFTSVSVAAIWLYVRGAKREQQGVIAAAYLLALIALFIRQFGMALPVAFGVAHLVRRGWSVRALATAGLPVVLFAAAHVGFQDWVVSTGRTPKFAESLSDLPHVSLSARIPYLRLFAATMVPYFGLFVLPFLIYLAACRPTLAGLSSRWVFWTASAGLGLFIFAMLVWRKDLLPTLGVCLLPYGLGPIPLFDNWIKGRNVPVTPGTDAFWMFMSAISSWGTAVLVLTAGRFSFGLIASLKKFGRGNDAWPQALLLTYCACYVGAILLATLLDSVFDRYLIAVIIPLIALLVIHMKSAAPTGRRQLVLFTAPLLVCALLSVLTAHDYLAFNRTRWKITDLLEQNGVKPQSIDGGFEYNGLKTHNPFYKRSENMSWWWVRDNQYIVALGPMPGYETVEVFGFRHWFWPTQYSLRILRRL